MHRLRIAWSGSGVVGGGLTTLYFGNTGTLSSVTPAVNTFLTAIKGNVPNTVTWNIPNGGDVIDFYTGQLQGTWTSGGAYTIVCTGTNNWASGVGGRIKWGTADIINGRRVAGAMYLCPIANNLFDTDGSLNNTMVTNVNTAAATFVATTGLDMVVWHRPSAPGASDGSVAGVTTGVMADKVSWLRTRRT